MTRFERTYLCCTYLLCKRSNPVVYVYVCMCVGVRWGRKVCVVWKLVKATFPQYVPVLRGLLAVATAPPRHAAVGWHCYCHQFLRLHTFHPLRLLMWCRTLLYCLQCCYCCCCWWSFHGVACAPVAGASAWGQLAFIVQDR